MMTDKTRTLPKTVRTRALWALTVITDWNNAVLGARRMEVVDGCIGRYEHDLIDDPRWGLKNKAEDILNILEGEALKLGWSAEDFYRALGQPKATVIPQSDRIMDWSKGAR
jgi:hypothetical protein